MKSVQENLVAIVEKNCSLNAVAKMFKEKAPYRVKAMNATHVMLVHRLGFVTCLPRKCVNVVNVGKPV